ncbi:MAG: TonB-dependent receptor [Bacteroides sp.]|nr:TonB-dependent receptor [Bacteroides sp.]
MRNLIIILFLLFSFRLAFCQTDNYTSSRLFDHVSFIELVQFVESESDIRFYYKNDWINDVFLSINNHSTLLPQLSNQLLEKGIGLYIEEGGIILIKGKDVLTRIPEFNSNENTILDKQAENEITISEKSYQQSKTIAFSEVLVIGDESKTGAGQSCSLRGTIKDAANGEPVIGATVYIEEIRYGAVTDVDGNFQMNLKTGKYKVRITHVSMKGEEYYFQVYSSGSILLEMRKELKELDEVVVSASLNDNVKGMQMGYERITVKAMKEIPAVMGERDLIKIASMLPGVESVGEGSSGINVRGSAADQNMFYLNKIPVYNTSHLFGFFTTFSPDIINDFTLYKSNIPAKYGGRLASIFDITTRQGNKKKFHGQGGISPVTAHLSIDGPLIKDKTSVIASWRSSYSNWIFNRIDNFDLQNSSAFFYDATLGVNTDINERNTLKVFGYKSFDKFSLLGKNDYQYSNTGASVSWKHRFKSALTLDLSSAYSQYSNDYNEKSNETTAYTHTYSIQSIETRADFSFLSKKNHHMSFGLNSTYYKNNRGDILPFGPESNLTPVKLGSENGLEMALYFSDKIELWNKLSISAGLRYSFFMELGPKEVYEYYDGLVDINNVESINNYGKGEIIHHYSKPEIRTSIKYSLAPNISIKASYNSIQQYIFMLSNTIAISPNDQWKLVSSQITPPLVDQLAIGWYQNLFKNRIEANVEFYRKWINNTVEYKDGADFLSPYPIETQLLQGEQNVKGVEFMIKKKGGKLTGWLAYTYSRSYMKVDSDNALEDINHGAEYPSNYDRPHSFNLVLNQHFNRRFSLSANYIYTSGRPITLPVAAYYSEGSQLLHFSERNQYRLPDYIRLDLSLNIEGNLKRKKLAHSFWMLNIYNVFGRANAYSVYYESVNGKIQGYKLSIFARPIFTVSWNFKFGNYLTE